MTHKIADLCTTHVQTLKRASMEKAQLYDAESIGRLPWPDTADSVYTQRFLEPFVTNGASRYIDNVHAEVFALKSDSYVFPLVVPEIHPDNSYVCSPYNHYITFGKEHAGMIDNPLLSPLIKPLLTLMGKLGRAVKLDSVVYVNNWLYAIDLYPEGIEPQHLRAIVACLTQRFPERAIIFRSLNPKTNGQLMLQLKKMGFHLIASRYVWVTDTKKEEIFRTRIVKSDLRLWERNPYQILDEPQISATECGELLGLERLLYVIQHSPLQPQFNQNYMQLLVDQGLLNFKVLKLNGTCKGVAGYLQRNGTMYCPFFGYDKKDPEHNTIYRLLNTSLLLEAKKRGALFNQSAGAAFFKSVRRAEGCLESMAVYTQHLPRRQKAAWSILSSFVNALAPRYMRNY